MTLFYIYLGTTVASYVVCRIFSSACEKNLKRKGYKLVEEKKSFSEKLASFASTTFKSLIPVYNVINAITILCMGEKVYGYIEEKMLERGEIYKPADELIIEIDPKMQSSSNDENIIISKANYEKKHEYRPVVYHQSKSTYDESSYKESREEGPVLRRNWTVKR